MTPLDSALKTALEDPNKQSDFYDTFLNLDLYIPVHHAPGPQGVDRRAQNNEGFSPIIVEQKGRRIIPVFDTLERLQAWAKRVVQYIRMPAHALIQALHGEVHLGLNPGTNFYKEFVSGEIQWLQKHLQGAQPQQTTIPQGTQVFIGAPAKLPIGLVERLKPVLQRNREVRSAYLGQMATTGVGGKSRLILIFQADPVSQQTLEAVIHDLSVAVRGTLPPGEDLDIIPYVGQAVDRAIVEELKPFYTKGG